MSTVLLEKSEGIARVILNQPPLNVLNIVMIEELSAVLESLEGDRDTRVVVIAANGKAFSAGVDVKDHLADKVADMLRSFHRVFHVMERIEQPIVAAVRGAALGGGCELAIFCDLIFASEKAKFGQAEIKLAVYPPVAAVLLPRIIGRKKAMELLLFGDNIDAQEAERIGLVNKVVPDAQFDEELEKFIGKLATLSGPALRFAKYATTIGVDLPFTEALDEVERLYLHELMRTEDATEGLMAFMEKRAPVWKNR